MPSKDELEADVAKLQRRIKFLEKAIAQEANEIEVLISNALPDEFPLYPADWPRSEGFPDRCVGDHVPVSLVMTLIDRYKKASEVANSFTRIYYRPIYDKNDKAIVEFWRDPLAYKIPVDTFLKPIFIQEL